MDHSTNRYVQIGNICAQWSSLEYMFASGIWLMIGVDQEVGKIVTGNLDAKQRANMALALAWQVNAPVPYKKAVKEVLVEMRDNLIHRRNEAVHGIHFGDEAGDTISIEMHRGKGGRAPRPMRNQDLAELGKAINAASTKMANANTALAQSYMSKIGFGKQFSELVATILRNNSLTSDDGETNGPG
jgi:hypothetical protein